jgi:hypothetical protein
MAMGLRLLMKKRTQAKQSAPEIDNKNINASPVKSESEPPKKSETESPVKSI